MKIKKNPDILEQLCMLIQRKTFVKHKRWSHHRTKTTNLCETQTVESPQDQNHREGPPIVNSPAISKNTASITGETEQQTVPTLDRKRQSRITRHATPQGSLTIG